MVIEIRSFQEKDWQAVWSILHEVFLKGDTFPNNPDTSEGEAKIYWVEQPKHTFVAELNGVIVGSYHIKDNQLGLGSHIANAGYVVRAECRGMGVGLSLAQHSIEFARLKGYLAMQFNLVVSTNLASIELWKKLGFSVIGAIPKAFNHKSKGLVDAFIMYRDLA